MLLIFGIWLKYTSIIKHVPSNKNEYVGIDGNDDAGTLSVWYILSSLVIYPIAGTDIYQLGSPLFKSAEINLGGNKLTILSENYSPTNIYVKEVFLNYIVLDKRWGNHSEIENGGTLKFIMTDNPDL